MTKNGTLTLIKGGKMPELDSVKICMLSEEAQAKIDSKAEYREKILHFLHNDDLFRIGNTNVSTRNAVYLEKVDLQKKRGLRQAGAN